MAQTTLNQHPRDRLRAHVDRGVQGAVTVSGLLVLMTLMLIFVYLLLSVLPLFKPASLGTSRVLPMSYSSPALAIGMDVQQRIGYRIDRQGEGHFYPLQAPNNTPIQQTLLSQPTLLAHAVGERDLFALARADGRLIVAQADFAPSGGGEPQWRFPLGQEPLAFDPHGQALTLLSLAQVRRGNFLLAAVTDDNRLLFGRFSPTLQGQPTEIPLTDVPQQLLLTPDGRQLYLLTGNQLARYQIEGAQPQLRETRTLGEHPPYRLTALPGGAHY